MSVARAIEDAPTLPALDVLDLLWMYQGSLATRAFSAGNREYLELMLDAAKRLIRAAARAPASPLLVPRATISRLVTLLEGQGLDNFRETSEQALDLLRELRDRQSDATRAPSLYARSALPRLRKDYDSIVVYFGSAMGLGDQITFFQFLSPLVQRCDRAAISVYTLYPGLWSRVIPRTEELSYRDDPLRPFLDINRRPIARRQLVVTADFELFHLHDRVIAEAPGRDILEISLGRRAAWFNKSDSPWIFFEAFWSLRENNYMFMHQLAGRMIPAPFGRALWSSIRPRDVDRLVPRRRWWHKLTRGPRAGHLKEVRAPTSAPAAQATIDNSAGAGRQARAVRKTVFINPFTSKELPLSAEGWAQAIRDIQDRVRGTMELDVVIFPGLEPNTRAIASDIHGRLRAFESPISARVLGNERGPLTPETALTVLLEAVGSLDFAITVDTFSAHLIPMFGVCTVVLAYHRFRRFWVPSNWVFNRPAMEFAADGPAFVASVLQQLSGDLGADHKQRAARLKAATEQAAGRLDVHALRTLEGALADIFQRLPGDWPRRQDVQVWMMLWSRLAGAMEKETIKGGGLTAYIDRWSDDDSFKLLALPA